MNWDDVVVIAVVIGAFLLAYGIISQDVNWKENMFIEPNYMPSCERQCTDIFNGTVNGLYLDDKNNVICNCTIDNKEWGFEIT